MGASNRARLLAESRSKNRANKGGKGTSLHRCKEGRRHPSRGRRHPLLRTDTHGVSRQSNPPVRRSGKLRLGVGQQLGVRSLGGPEEYRRVDQGQRNRKNSRQGSGHSHRCIAPPPPISLHFEGMPPIKLDPQDIYGVYPNNFGNMVAVDAATEDEVSASRQGPIPTRT